MNDTDAVRSLVEMGISKDVAEDALRRTNGDVEAAGNFIFCNDAPAQISENVEQRAHIELPAGSTSGFQPGDLNEYISNAPDTESEDFEEIDVEEDSVETGPSLEGSGRKGQISDPTVVLPLPPNFLFEGYFALFCLFVANYMPHLLARPDFIDLNYDKNWYRGDSYTNAEYRLKYVNKNESDDEQIEIVPKDELTQEDGDYTLQSELLWQLQRLASVVNSRMSDRAYVRAKMFAIAVESQVQRNMAEAEHLHEVLPSFIKSVAVDLEMCPNFQDNEVRKCFISSAFHTPSNSAPQEETTMKTWLSLFHFLPEEYETNLYRMFNALLFADDSVESDQSDSPDGEGENSLSEIAPVFTIVFDEMEETTEAVPLAEGVEIPLEFYPQLYTKECKDKLIKHIIAKRRQSQTDSRAILQEVTDLKSFQGKDLSKFINSSLDYLQKDEKSPELIKGLLNLKDQITDKKTKKMNEYKEIAHRLQSEWNLSLPEIQIVKTAKELGLIDEPYLLTMAVISPYMYYTRNRDGQWFFVQSTPYEASYNVRACSSPLEIQDAIKQHTRRPSEAPLMFIYCKKGFIPDDDTVLKALENNQGCHRFAKDDQLQLNKMQDLSSSALSSANASIPADL